MTDADRGRNGRFVKGNKAIYNIKKSESARRKRVLAIGDKRGVFEEMDKLRANLEAEYGDSDSKSRIIIGRLVENLTRQKLADAFRRKIAEEVDEGQYIKTGIIVMHSYVEDYNKTEQAVKQYLLMLGSKDGGGEIKTAEDVAEEIARKRG